VFASILPEWFGGVRYSFAISWKITTLAELVAAQEGIGYIIGIQMRTLSMVGILSWTILFTIVMLGVEYGVFQQIEKRVFSWRQGEMIGFV
jgi:ABC-type nitrate/sulfonate/bicarbonate transport system permease component